MNKRNRPAAPTDRPLTLKQAKFVAALLADPGSDQSRAAVVAGYSPKSAEKLGSELMCAPQYRHVQAAYHAQAKEKLAQFGLDADTWMKLASEILLADWNQVFEIRNGRLEVKDSADLSDAQRLLHPGCDLQRVPRWQDLQGQAGRSCAIPANDW